MFACRFTTRLIRRLGFYAIFAALLLAVVPAGAIDAELPALGANAQLNIQRETQIGGSVYVRLRNSGLIETNPLIDRYINDLGFRLLAGLENRVRNYRFFVVRNDAVNAFALPGGFIGINRGLIYKTRNQHQLASVLAHEIAHVRLRHGMDMMEKGRDLNTTAVLTMLAGMLLGGVDSQVGSAVAFGGIAGSQQAMINYTRENEYEADRIGIGLMHNANFDPNGMVEFFGIMSQLSGSSEIASIEYLRTHPLGNNRIAEAANRASRLPFGANQVDDYLLFKDYLTYISSDYMTPEGSDYLRALASMKAADHAAADTQLAALYRSDNENVWYGLAYAENLVDLGRANEAELVYRRLLDIFPDDYVLSMRLLRLLRQAGHHQSALVIARRLENQYSNDKQVFFELSEIYDALGRPALRLMAQAEFHRISGNLRAAIKLYDQVLASSDADLATESRAREKRQLLLQRL